MNGRFYLFVVETDVRHPTDVSLLWDAVHTALRMTVRFARTFELSDWRQHYHEQLDERLTLNALPKKGCRNAVDHARENAP